MVGIYLGGTPINMGDPVKEVYVGAVKVWPAGLYTSYYGTKAARLYAAGTGGNLAAQTSAGMYYDSSVLGSSTGKGALNVGSPTSIMGAIGNVCLTGTIGARSPLTFGVTSPAAGQNIAAVSTFRFASSYNYYTATRIIVPIADDDAVPESYARFNSSGVLQWELEPGWTCVRTSTGRYTVTAPRALLNTIVWASVSHAASDEEGTASVDSVDTGAGSFRVLIDISTSVSDLGFSVGVMLV